MLLSKKKNTPKSPNPTKEGCVVTGWEGCVLKG